MHEDYSDVNEDAGHSMASLYSKLAMYSADKEIIAKVHMVGRT